MCSGTGQSQIKTDSKTAPPISTTIEQSRQLTQDTALTGTQQVTQTNINQPPAPVLRQPQSLPAGQIIPPVQQQLTGQNVQPLQQRMEQTTDHAAPPLQLEEPPKEEQRDKEQQDDEQQENEQQEDKQQNEQQQEGQRQYASVTWERELRQMGTVEAMKHATGNQINLKKAQEKASETSQNIIKEFNIGKSVTSKSKWRREKAFEKKKKLYDGEEASAWREARNDQAWRNPDFQPQPVELGSMRNVIVQIMNFSSPLITFKDDEAFVESYKKHYIMLEDSGDLETALKGKTQADLDAVVPGFNIEKVREKAERYTGIRDYYRAKMDIISSPFYMVLRKGDTIRMTTIELTEAIDKCGEDRKELKQYLEAALRLKVLEEDGILNDRNKKRGFYACEQCVRWRAQRDNQDWRKSEDAPAVQPRALFANFADSKDLIEKMLNCPTDFMKYTDDIALMDHFEENYAVLDEFCSLKDVLAGKTQEELDKVTKGQKLEAVQKTVLKYIQIRDFYRAKMDIMSSPYFMVMSKRDTADLTIEQLEEQIKNCDLPEKKLYLEASLKLRLLADQDIYHNTKGKGALRVETSGGMSKTHGAYFAVGTLDKGLDKSLDFMKEGTTGKWKNNLSTMTLSTEEEGKIVGVEKRKAKQTTDSIKFMDVGVGAHARGRVVETGAYLSTLNKNGNASVRMDVGEVQASGKIGATLGFNWENGLTAEVGASATASATGARVSGTASYATDTKVGKFGAGIDGNAEFLTAKATGTLKAGRFDMMIGGKKETVSGIAAEVGAEASVFSGTATGHITLFGVKINVKATGNLIGAGVTAGGYLTTGKAGLTLGATLGMGGNLSLDFDATYWTDRIGKYFLGKLKKKMGVE
ncbi:MAG: hypothetical protein K5985_04155 [Lachnospiraceae bacterium]|nr:hypothetical protein [Lachnospiraceae bacterium]